MPDEIVIVNSNGERSPFREAWLRGTLAAMRNPAPPMEPLIRTVRDAILRSPDLVRDATGSIVVTTDTLRHLVLEALEAEDIGLTLAETIRNRAMLGLAGPLTDGAPTGPLEELRTSSISEQPAIPGIGAGPLLLGRQVAAMAQSYNPKLAGVLQAVAEVSYMAANEALATYGPEMLTLAGEIMRVPPQRLSVARGILLANCERSREICGLPSLIDRYRDLFKEKWKKQDDESLDKYFRGFVENIFQLYSGTNDPTIYGEELEPGQKYAAVATTERDHIMKQANRSWPSMCVRKSRKLAGPLTALGGIINPDERPRAIEFTYVGRMRLALDARDVVEGRAIEKRWKADLKNDLPDDISQPGPDYVQEVQPGMQVYSYAWTLSDETIDEDILKKLEELREKFGDKLTDKAKDEVKDFFDGVAASLASALPVGGSAVAGGAGKVAGDLAAAGIKELLDYLLMLLQPTAYPSYRISHLVIWPAPYKPLSVVVTLRGGSGGDPTPAPLAGFDPNAIAITAPPARGGMEAFQYWFGASTPAPPCPRNAFFVMQQGRVLSEGVMPNGTKKKVILIQGILAPPVMQWRSPEQGFGVVVRQDELNTSSLTQVGCYLTALRADVRIVDEGWV